MLTFFPPQHFREVIHCHLICIASDEKKPRIIFKSLSLHTKILSLIWPFLRFFSLALVSTVWCPCVWMCFFCVCDLSCLKFIEHLRFVGLCFLSNWESFGHYFFSFVFLFFHLSSPFGITITCALDHLKFF